MTRLVRPAACCLLLAGGTLLAFFSGGYFDQPRLIAALCAWLLVAAAALTAPRPLPRSAPGRLALGGLAALAALTVASIAWAPLAGPALDDAQRALLYLAAFAAGFAFLRADDFVEPALAGGALVVVLYGLSERLVPGLVDLNASRTAGGRLEQPITYWNAMGAVAAMGLVVCARMAADAERPNRLRAAAAAAVPPLGAAIYLSFSRGAIAAVAAGLLVLVLIAKEQAQLRAAAVAVAVGLAASVACAALPWVRSLSEAGSLPESVQGLVALVLLLALGALAAWITLRWTAATSRGTALNASPRARLLAAAGLGVALVLVSAAIEGSPRSSSPQAGATTARLSSLDSARYGYWRVALETFADQPLLGAGASGFQVEWMRERPERDASSDAHSLYLETLAELGLAGAAALLMMLTGLAVSGRRALLAAPHAALGLVALLVTYLVHAALDWDWEMPAVTLPALAAAAAIVGVADRAGPSAGRARRGARAGSGGAPRESPAATAADPL